MNDTTFDARSHMPSPSAIECLRVPHPILLWQLRGSTDVLRGLVIETSFGYALALELDAELVSWQLHATVDGLVAAADRIESALVSQGWRVMPDAPPSSTHTLLWRASCRCDPCAGSDHHSSAR